MGNGPLSFAGTARFQVLSCLGSGGMGVVYEAFDSERQSRVALKTLRSPEPVQLLRLKEEFRSLADLAHPNLVQLHELHAEGEHWFFSMELVDGVSFLDHVRPGGSCHEARLRQALVQLAAGLAALHAAGKVHRDVKSSNILVTSVGRLVLLDFGVAADVVRPRRSDLHDVVGTALTMAPEQSVGGTVGLAADWYSVGVLLFQALTGRSPFEGDSLDVLSRKRQESAPDPASLVAGLPADLTLLCRELLALDAERRPTGRDVLTRLGARDPEPISVPSGADSFVGRTAERIELWRAFQAARAGEMSLVYVVGESGVGKSALLRCFLEEVEALERGAVVLVGRCFERESVPYKGVDGVIDDLARHMARLEPLAATALLPRRASHLAQVFPVLNRVASVASAPRPRHDVIDPQELRQRVFGALRELLGRLAERRPCVVVIDDLQWADDDSLALLAEALRAPEAPPLLLVAGVRAGADFVPPTALATLPARTLTLGGLTAEESRQLATRLLGGPSERAAAIARDSAGHPLFIDALARQRGTDTASLGLEELLAKRLAELAAPARRLLELVAVAGTPLAQDSARAALSAHDDDPGAFSRHVLSLRAAHLVRSAAARSADTLEPYHDRVRAVVMASLGTAPLAALHARLAAVFETEGGADPEVLAVHWQGAGEPARAARHAEAAALQASHALAFDRAARLYQLALDLWARAGAAGAPDPLTTGVAGQHERTLAEKLGEAHVNAGRGAQAAAAFLIAARGASVAETLDLERRAAEQLLLSGRIDQGLDLTHRVLAAIGMKLAKTPRQALMSLLIRRGRIRLRGLGFRRRDRSQVSPEELTRIDVCWSVAVNLGLVDTIRGADFQTRHLLLALAAGEPYRAARALSLEACYSATAGGPGQRRTERVLALAEALAVESGSPHAQGILATARAVSSFLLGRYVETETQAGVADEIFREHCVGVAWEQGTARLYRLLALLYLGEIRELAERAPLMLKEARERGDLYAATNTRAWVLPFALMADDDVATARGEAAGALADWWKPDYSVQHHAEMQAQAQIDCYAGEGQRAFERVSKDLPALERSLLMRVEYIRLEVTRMRARGALVAALETPAHKLAMLACAERDARTIAAARRPWSDPFAALLQAGVAAARGLPEPALAALERALPGFEAADMRLMAATVRRRRGELLGGDEGRALIVAADQFMTAQRIRHPVRMARALAPGFPEP